MDLKITGQVVELLDEQSGEGRNGPWRKREFILETEGDYPAKICVVQWGDDIEKFAVEEGDRVSARIDIRSREYNGRWYTDVKAWKVEKESNPDRETGGQGQPPVDPDPGSGDDILPF